jgi:glycosyltransferase involved in cell wall biosynthesis
VRDTSKPARLIHVASLNRVKDQTTLIQAVRLVRDAGCPFHLDIVGADTLDGRIQAMCRGQELQEHVSFHGFLPHRELRPLMERSDLLIVSSRHEADPIVLLEAAVAGVPAVSTAVGHARDWAPEAARTARVGDPEALGRQIQCLLAREEERLAVAGAAQERAVREDADWTASRVLSIYESLVT